MAELKTRGSGFALHADMAMRPERHRCCSLRNYVLMDVAARTFRPSPRKWQRCPRWRREALCGDRGANAEAFHMCHKLQFALFMGPFITRRETLDTPVMGPSRAKCWT